MNKSNKKSYKFQAQIYEERDKNEQTYEQAMKNKDYKSEVILRNRDLRPYAAELFGQELE